ncbi:hypothetical protein OEZ71_05040 [Defluviimonas sp. WL0050]|uniref:Phasin protein n=1 Tax=Albidovulum litorale TaxID=2984134 RepID=A0ABT2ZKK4_9RHOB|nr:hypothetical protein [Defluviimonas sp. WL0050]MCV2871654.1 hypothetical protein [Defluviimonas sp. WL0050]
MAKPAAPSDADMVTDLSHQTLAAFRLNPLTGPLARHFWEIQEQLLCEAEEFSQHWFARRHTAARSALKASEAAAGNTVANPAAVMKALSEWQLHSAERIAQDMQEWAGFCARCAGHLAKAEVETGQEALEKASDEIAMIKTEHSDPV